MTTASIDKCKVWNVSYIAPKCAVTATLQSGSAFSQNFNHLLTILPAILFLVVYSTEIKKMY